MGDKLKLSKIESKGYGNIYKLPMLDRDLDVVAKAFYAYLCSFAGAGDTAFPGMDKICHDLNVSRQRLEKHRKALVEKGYINIIQVKGEKGRFSHNEYKINREISPLLQKPTTDEPTTDEPTTENVTTNNNSFNNNNNNNNSNNIKDNVPAKADTIPYETIVEHLNLKTSKNFKHQTPATRKLIKARWNEGNRLEDFKKVIDTMVHNWKDDFKMKDYLQPSTLFSSKFDNYLNTEMKNKQQFNRGGYKPNEGFKRADDVDSFKERFGVDAPF